MKFIYYPIKPWIEGQHFGESLACVKDYKTPYQVIASKVNGVCPSGFEELYPKLGMVGHTGIDASVTEDTRIYSSVEGKVVAISTEPERGLGVDVVSSQKQDFGSYGVHWAKVRVWHLKSISCVLGQSVALGDELGVCDNTGFSAGTHLHFEVKPVDQFCDSTGVCIYNNTLQNNGFFGAVNPEVYFNGLYAQDQWKHIFQNDLFYGVMNEEVKALQRALKIDGEFPQIVDETGYYGETTRQAVYAFQKKYQVASSFILWLLQGRRVGLATRSKLNQLYS